MEQMKIHALYDSFGSCVGIMPEDDIYEHIKSIGGLKNCEDEVISKEGALRICDEKGEVFQKERREINEAIKSGKHWWWDYYFGKNSTHRVGE